MYRQNSDEAVSRALVNLAAIEYEIAAQRVILGVIRLKLLVLKYSPDQPRVPAGCHEGGEWCPVGGGSGAATGSGGAYARLAGLKKGRDITVAEVGRVVGDAKENWVGTPYAPKGTPHQGASAQRQVAADCSGSVYRLFNDNGFYYPYKNTADFAAAAAKPGFPFRMLGTNEPSQVGDVVLYPGHMSVYAGMGQIYSAHRSGKNFDTFPIKYFGTKYQFYRYQLPSK